MAYRITGQQARLTAGCTRGSRVPVVLDRRRVSRAHPIANRDHLFRARCGDGDFLKPPPESVASAFCALTVAAEKIDDAMSDARSVKILVTIGALAAHDGEQHLRLQDVHRRDRQNILRQHDEISQLAGCTLFVCAPRVGASSRVSSHLRGVGGRRSAAGGHGHKAAVGSNQDVLC